MRTNLLAQLNELAALGIHTLVVGGKGSGKTHLLNSIGGLYFPTPNLGVYELSCISGTKGSLTAQLAHALKKEAMLLAIDDLHTITRSKKQIVNALANTHTIIAAARFVPDGFEHWHTIHIPPLSERECAELLKPYTLDEKTRRTVMRKAKGNPGSLLHMARMHEALGYHKKERNAHFNLNMSQITNYVLSLRYIFMFSHQWQLYSLVSFVAYALIGYNRRSRYRK